MTQTAEQLVSTIRIAEAEREQQRVWPIAFSVAAGLLMWTTVIELMTFAAALISDIHGETLEAIGASIAITVLALVAIVVARPR